MRNITLTLFVLLATLMAGALISTPTSAQSTPAHLVVSSTEDPKTIFGTPFYDLEVQNQGEEASSPTMLQVNAHLFSNADAPPNLFASNPTPLSYYIPSLSPGESHSVSYSGLGWSISRNMRHMPVVIDAKFDNDQTDNHQLLVVNSPDWSTKDKIEAVSFFALAFDSSSYTVGNLFPQIEASMESLIKESKNREHAIGVVLADDYGEDNTTVTLVYDGLTAVLPALPTESGWVDSDLQEYNMSDGKALGGALRWTRYAFPEETITFTFVGHGSAVMPNIDVQSGDALSENQGGSVLTMPAWIVAEPAWIVAEPAWIVAEPAWIVAEPSYATDSHPISMISMQDLAEALRAVVDNNQKQIDIVNLLHCFSLSIEEAHELAPFTSAIIGNANYAFFDADMPGEMLKTMNEGSDDNALDLAADMMYAYDNLLPQDGYPRTMAVVNTAEVLDIKTEWDNTANALLDALASNRRQTRNQLVKAYLASTKYDTTSCDSEFSLKSPDAMVDMYEFATHISGQFGAESPVGQAAQNTADQLDQAVYAVTNQSGLPWFGDSETAEWQFTGKGISLYADLLGIQQEDSTTLSWQAAYYTKMASPYNQTPFAFVAGSEEDTTWADVLRQFWGREAISAESCLITIPPDFDRAEVKVVSHSEEAVFSIFEGMQIDIAAQIELDTPLRNAIIQFDIELPNGDRITDEVKSGRLAVGINNVPMSSKIQYSAWSWNNDYDITITVDPYNYIIEENEDDNTYTGSGDTNARAQYADDVIQDYD